MFKFHKINYFLVECCGSQFYYGKCRTTAYMLAERLGEKVIEEQR
jgi:hypothetical protein